jgi:hypothetical protein
MDDIYILKQLKNYTRRQTKQRAEMVYEYQIQSDRIEMGALVAPIEKGGKIIMKNKTIIRISAITLTGNWAFEVFGCI